MVADQATETERVDELDQAVATIRSYAASGVQPSPQAIVALIDLMRSALDMASDPLITPSTQSHVDAAVTDLGDSSMTLFSNLIPSDGDGDFPPGWEPPAPDGHPNPDDPFDPDNPDGDPNPDDPNDPDNYPDDLPPAPNGPATNVDLAIWALEKAAYWALRGHWDMAWDEVTDAAGNL